MREPISLEDGWAIMETGIKKLKNAVESSDEPPLTTEDFLMLHSTVYRMCTQKYPHGYSQQLYEKCRATFQEYIVSTILPSLMEKHDEDMLCEVVKQWKNHKEMVMWMSRIFCYLDIYYVSQNLLPDLQEVGINCFRDMVYSKIHSKAKDAVLALIRAEREGMEINQALLKNVLEVFVEIGSGELDQYETDFETFLLEDSASYYHQKALSLIAEDSSPDFILKAEECLKKEKERVSHYLHASSVEKLIELVQNQLLSVYALNLAYHKASSEDPKGLVPVGNLVKQRITDEGTPLV